METSKYFSQRYQNVYNFKFHLKGKKNFISKRGKSELFCFFFCSFSSYFFSSLYYNALSCNKLQLHCINNNHLKINAFYSLLWSALLRASNNLSPFHFSLYILPIYRYISISTFLFFFDSTFIYGRRFWNTFNSSSYLVVSILVHTFRDLYDWIICLQFFFFFWCLHFVYCMCINWIDIENLTPFLLFSCVLFFVVLARFFSLNWHAYSHLRDTNCCIERKISEIGEMRKMVKINNEMNRYWNNNIIFMVL